MSNNSRDTDSGPARDSEPLSTQKLRPDSALFSKDTTAANSTSPSMVDSPMDSDIEKSADLHPGDPPADTTSDQDVIANNEKNLEDAGDANVATPQAVNPWDPSQFPEGGLEAWTVVLGAACGIWVSFGWINCEHFNERTLRGLVLVILTFVNRHRGVSRILSNTSAEGVHVTRNCVDTLSRGLHDVHWWPCEFPLFLKASVILDKVIVMFRQQRYMLTETHSGLEECTITMAHASSSYWAHSSMSSGS